MAKQPPPSNSNHSQLSTTPDQLPAETTPPNLPSLAPSLQKTIRRLSSVKRSHHVALPVLMGGLMIVSVVSAAVIGNGSGSSSARLPGMVAAQPVKVFETESVDSITVLRDYTGEIVPRQSSELGFERAGTLVQFVVDEGSRVQAGDILAKLDMRDLETQMRQIEAQLAQEDAKLRELQSGPRDETIAAARAVVSDLEGQLNLARDKLDRRQGLFEQGAISREQYNEAFSEVSTLQARWDEANSQLNELLAGTRSEQIDGQLAVIAQLKVQLDSLQLEREKSILLAPFPGTVSARFTDEGTVVTSGTPILRLVEDRALEAHVGVPASVVRNFAPNDLYEVEIESVNYDARVDSILPELDPVTRTLTVILNVEGNNIDRLFPGQLARLQVPERVNETGFWLPTQALVQGVRGLWSCYVLGMPVGSTSSDDGAFEVEQRVWSRSRGQRPAETPSDDGTFEVEQRDIEILHVEEDRVFVRGTLLPGDRVISSSSHRLTPGQWVRPVDTPAEQAFGPAENAVYGEE